MDIFNCHGERECRKPQVPAIKAPWPPHPGYFARRLRDSGASWERRPESAKTARPAPTPMLSICVHSGHQIYPLKRYIFSVVRLLDVTIGGRSRFPARCAGNGNRTFGLGNTVTLAEQSPLVMIAGRCDARGSINIVMSSNGVTRRVCLCYARLSPR